MRNLIFLLILSPGLLLAQPILPLTDESFPEAVVGKPNTYAIESLMEYTDGGDLFIEFGFTSLMVQEIAWEKAKIKVEVYLMETPEGAFGVYSLSVMKCLQRDSLTPFDCNSTYQYQTAYGNLYISVTSESGSEAARARYMPVANAIMQKNPQQIVKLPTPFDQPLFKKGRQNLVYIQGLTGLQNSLFPWQDLFLSVRFGMYAILLANPESEFYFARIRFETPADMMRFLTQSGLTMGGVAMPNTNTNDGIYREFRQLDEQTIYFLQSQEPWPISAVINPEK
jgi:hypothetical protein